MSDSSTLAARHRSLPRLVIDSSTSYNGSISLVSSTPYTNSGSVLSSSAYSMPDDESYIARSMYDFDAVSSEQLSFQAGELLEVLYSDPSGWSAARREASNDVGWIPSAYVELFSQAPSGENHDQSAPCSMCGTAPMSQCRCQPFILSPDSASGREWMIRRDTLSPSLLSASMQTGKSLSGFFLSPQVGPASDVSQEAWRSPILGKICPPSPFIPPPPTPNTAPLFHTVHLRPSRSHPSVVRAPKSAVDGPPTLAHTHARRTHRVESAGSNPLPALLEVAWIKPEPEGDRYCDEAARVRPTTPDTPPTANGSPNDDEAKNIVVFGSAAAVTLTTDEDPGSPLSPILSLAPDKGEIRFDEDGAVMSGTLYGLVKHLVAKPKDVPTDAHFRHTFLSTLHTLGSSGEIFDLLVQQYHLEPPSSLSAEQVYKWRQKHLLPVQKRVLSVFATWLGDHRMIEDDPPVAQRLQRFLVDVSESPDSDVENVAIAQDVMHSLEQLTFDVPTTPTIVEKSHKRKTSSKSEIFKIDPAALSENLCLHEHMLYAKIRPQECFEWVRNRNGDTVANLAAFCSLYDKLAAWVKHSILWTDPLSRRADAVDFWIKVAEKCRAMHNYSSMSAIVTALSSTVISRLHLTWARASRASHLEALTRTNDPSGNFAAFRHIQRTLAAPCVPFVGPYLTDIVHLHDQYPDEDKGTQPMFNIVKRRKWVAVAESMLCHQDKTFPFAQDPDVMRQIEANFVLASNVDQATLLSRSLDLQEGEKAGANLRRGLEAAGF